MEAAVLERPAPRRAGRPPKPCERCGGLPALDRVSVFSDEDEGRHIADDHGFAEGFRLCDPCYDGIVTGCLTPPRKEMPPRQEKQIEDLDGSEHNGLDAAPTDIFDTLAARLRGPSLWEQIDAVSDAKIKDILQQITDGKGIREIEREQGWRSGTGIARLKAAVAGGAS